MTQYGIRIRKRASDPFERGVQYRRANTQSGWTYWRNTWPTKRAAELRLAVYRAKGYRGHVFEIVGLDIVERGLWNARAPKNDPVHDNWSDAPIVWHHTADSFRGITRAQNVDHAQAMQYFHQYVRDWNDLAYNWLVFPNGDVFEGRGFGVRGAGAADPPKQWNEGYIHIAFVGDYRDRSVTPAASRAADQLEAYIRRRGADGKPEVGHGDLMATSCPGRGVREDRKL